MTRVVLAVLLTFALLAPARARAQARAPVPVSADDGAARALALAPDLAFADPVDPNPGSGRGKRIAGWVGISVGVVESVNVALCHRFESMRGGRGQRACITLAATLATLGFVIGIPVAIAGQRQRARQKGWLKRHGLALLEQVEVDARRDAAGLGWQLRF
ncbi:MAG: hypothetical protein ABW252_16850 [Polyangiales bacterium]